MERKALIIGGGIAGPILAMFLRRAGIEPVVYERRTEFQDVPGSWFSLDPTGMSVLEALGVRAEVEGLGWPTEQIAFLNHKGRQLGGHAVPSLLIRRGVVNRTLHEAARDRGVEIHYGRRLTGIEGIDGDRVVAHFEDGSRAEGDVLVGCDGIRSTTRAIMSPSAPGPRFTGLMSSGGMTPGTGLPSSNGVIRMIFGTKAFFAYQVLDSGDTYWFQNTRRDTEPDRHEVAAISDAEWRRSLLELHAEDTAPIGHLIRSSGLIDRWIIHDLPNLPTWHRGRVGVIGDAAHAASPSAGHGASMAMEDAIVLAKCLRDLPDAREALATFERLRKAHAEKVIAVGRRNGERKGPTTPVGRAFRDLMMPMFLKLGSRSLQEIVTYQEEWDKPVLTRT